MVEEEPEQTNRGVYVIRCGKDGKRHWYVGSSPLSVWGRIREHATGKTTDWFGDKEYAGIEVVFLERSPPTVQNGQAPRLNEAFVARRFIETFGVDRVYGAGYTPDKPPAEPGYNNCPTAGFIIGVTGSDWDWLLDNCGSSRSVYYKSTFTVVNDPPLRA